MLTVQSCRALAADDSCRATLATLANSRARFQASADAWNERADFLERIGRLSALRRMSDEGSGQPEAACDRGLV